MQGLGPVLGAALPQASFRLPCLYPLSAHHLSVERGLRGVYAQAVNTMEGGKALTDATARSGLATAGNHDAL